MELESSKWFPAYGITARAILNGNMVEVEWSPTTPPDAMLATAEFAAWREKTLQLFAQESGNDVIKGFPCGGTIECSAPRSRVLLEAWQDRHFPHTG